MSEDGQIDYIAQAEALSTSALVGDIASWKPGSVQHIAGTFVLEKRKARHSELRGWVAVGISIISLLTSVCVLLFK
jgi:hypothetical protein